MARTSSTAANLCCYGALAAFVARPTVRLVLVKREATARAGSAVVLLVLAMLTLGGASIRLPA